MNTFLQESFDKARLAGLAPNNELDDARITIVRYAVCGHNEVHNLESTDIWGNPEPPGITKLTEELGTCHSCITRDKTK